MKKILALTLAMLMVLAMFAGCAAKEESAPAEEAAPVEDAPAEEAVVEVDALNILFSSTYNESETGGQLITYFIDQLNELSGGKITVNIQWGGTLFDAAGELDAVSSGAVNMIALGHARHTGTLTYLSFPDFAPGGTQAALDYFNAIMFENEETSKLINDQATELGIKYLNVIAGGANAMCSKNEFTDLGDMAAKSSAFGNFNTDIFNALGFNTIAVVPPDVYDGLDRGLFDSTQMGFAPMVALAWYEVAPYWCLDGTYTAGNFFTVNLEWWDGLTAAQQEVIQKAADATEAYSATIYDNDIANLQKQVEEATGNAFVTLSDEDVAKFWSACFEASAGNAMNAAETNGTADNMHKILEVAAEATGYDWKG